VKEVLVISGKGGTGKTCITSAFAALAKDKVTADCDVDAANLYMLLNPRVVEEHEFYSGYTVRIDEDKCTECGICVGVCRFDAIHNYRIDELLCEGCCVCVHVCPHEAIDFQNRMCGHWFVSDTDYGPLVHAKLGIAEENSGKLVTQVRKTAAEVAKKHGADLIITDGAPGTGCPVIASLSGVDLAVIVTEPTVSGIHDMERVIKLADGFGVKCMVCINKYDLDEEKTKEIEIWCYDKGISLGAKIPFDKKVNDAVVKQRPPVEVEDSAAAVQMRNLWDKVRSFLSSK
jgi:MinD superfamily P-loop ATPase